jgi:hypothetical protein
MSSWRCAETRSARSHDFRWESAPTSWTKPGCSVSANLSVARLLGRQAPETPGFLACEYPMPGFRWRQMPWNAYGSSGDRFDGRHNRRAARRKAATCYCRFNTAMYTRIPAAEPRSSQLFTVSVAPKRVKLGHAMTGTREKPSHRGGRSRRVKIGPAWAGWWLVLLPRGGWVCAEWWPLGLGGGRMQRAARDAVHLWDVSPLKSLALGP